MIAQESPRRGPGWPEAASRAANRVPQGAQEATARGQEGRRQGRRPLRPTKKALKKRAGSQPCAYRGQHWAVVAPR
eukprot:502174-Pyramimonas_sp.AAC.1